MKQMRNIGKRGQSGFTLIELAVVVIILGILIFGATQLEDPDKAKAVSMLQTADAVGSGAKRLRMDAGCHPTRPDALFVAASAATSACGIDLRPKWQGPYVNDMPVTATGGLKASQVAAGATVTLTSAAGGAGTQHFVRISGVPNSLINRALQVCNGSTTDTGRCIGTTGGGGTGTFDVKYDETL